MNVLSAKTFQTPPMRAPLRRRTLVFRKLTDGLVKLFSLLAVALATGAMAWILYTVIDFGWSAISWDFLTNPSKPYGVVGGGIANALLGSLMITGFASLLAIPPGILAGICLSEYKDTPRLSGALRFAANILIGIPSVVVGLFIYGVLVATRGMFSGFAASVALAVIMFPVIMRTTEDMMAMIPTALRESALALGMTRTRATLCILCRAARNGLLTGILLAVSRVSGETAPLLFTALFADAWPENFFSGPTANMPILITEYTMNSPFEAMHRAGWGAALVVTLLVLSLNIITRICFREKNHGR